MDDGAKMALRDGAASAQGHEERRDVSTVGSTMLRPAGLTAIARAATVSYSLPI